MYTHIVGSTLKAVDYEVDMLAGHLLNALLNDVVAILVLDAGCHIFSQLIHNGHLFVESDDLKCFLNNTASIHVERQFLHFALDLLAKKVLLFITWSKLEHLLNNIVSKDISHELLTVWEHLFEYHYFIFI